MPQVLPMTRVEAYLAYKAGVIQESDLKPTLKTNFYTGLEHWLAYWCGLCNDYPTEDGQPKWYTEEEYYVAYLCGIAPDYPVNCYRRVGAYLRYIISVRWGKPEKPLTREEYYLSLMPTTYLPPNDPASIISIDDTAEAPFGDLKIYGDSFQQAYSGKNLLDLKDGTYSNNGITVVVKDGVCTANGTAVATSFVDLPTNSGSLTLRAETDYSFSINNTTTVAGENHCRIGNLSPAFSTSFSILNNSTTATSSTEQTTTNVLIFRSESGTTYTNFVIKPQLELGSTVTAYEPYVGGTPAPNPDYPQDIQVVTGEQTVSVTGKNLLKLSSREASNGVITTISEDSVLAATGSPTQNWATLTSPHYNNFFQYGDTVTFSLQSPAPAPIVAAFYDQDGNRQDIRIAKYGQSETRTLTVDPIRVVVIAEGLTIGALTSLVFDKPQLEKGSTATDFVPFQEQTYPISLGSLELCKLGDYQDYIWTDGEKWYKHKEIGYELMTGASSEPWGKSNSTANNLYIHEVYPMVKDNSAIEFPILCNRFSYVDRTIIYAQSKVGITTQTTGAGNSAVRIGFGIGSSINTVSLLRQWLSENNTQLYYPLATPTDEEITDATLISQLNALLEGGSYNYQTNIVVTAEDPNLPGLLQVAAAKYQ